MLSVQNSSNIIQIFPYKLFRCDACVSEITSELMHSVPIPSLDPIPIEYYVTPSKRAGSRLIDPLEQSRNAPS